MKVLLFSKSEVKVHSKILPLVQSIHQNSYLSEVRTIILDLLHACQHINSIKRSRQAAWRSFIPKPLYFLLTCNFLFILHTLCALIRPTKSSRLHGSEALMHIHSNYGTALLRILTMVTNTLTVLNDSFGFSSISRSEKSIMLTV